MPCVGRETADILCRCIRWRQSQMLVPHEDTWRASRLFLSKERVQILSSGLTQLSLSFVHSPGCNVKGGWIHRPSKKPLSAEIPSGISLLHLQAISPTDLPDNFKEENRASLQYLGCDVKSPMTLFVLSFLWLCREPTKQYSRETFN